LATWRFTANSDAITSIDSTGRVTERRGKNFEHERTLLETGTQGSLALLADDCRLLATIHLGKATRVWDLERGTLVRAFTAAADEGNGVPVHFLRKGKALMLSRIRSDKSQWVEEWDLATGLRIRDWKQPVANFTVPGVSPEENFFVSKVGQGRFVRIATTPNAEELLVKTDLATGRQTVLRAVTRESLSRSLSFSPDGGLLANSSALGFVDIVEVVPWRKVATLSGVMAGMYGPAFSPDGARLVVGSSGTESITLWDVGSYERLLTLPTTNSVLDANAFSPDGNLLGASSSTGAATAAANGALYIWRAPSWAEIEAVEKHTHTR
jgi:WD40 repeat protein